MTSIKTYYVIITALLALTMSTIGLCAPTTHEHLAQQGHQQYLKGQFEQALETYKQAQTIKNDTNIQLFIATTYQSLGHPEKTLKILQNIIKHSPSNNVDFRVLNQLGELYVLLDMPGKAIKILQKNLVSLEKNPTHRSEAADTANRLANAYFADLDENNALTYYKHSLRLHQTTGLKHHSQALINLIRLHLYRNEIPQALKYFNIIKQAPYFSTTHQTLTHEQALQFIILAKIAQELYQELPSDPSLLKSSYQWLRHIFNNTIMEEHPTLKSYVYGYLGQLYETEKRYSEATRLTQLAISWSHKEHSNENYYIWLWQRARLLAKQHHTQTAITSYQEAIKELKSVQPALRKGKNHIRPLFFKYYIEPMFLELIDLQLQQAQIARIPEQKHQQLFAARNTAEYLKISELQDYFDSEFTPLSKSKKQALENFIDRKTAIIYPIALKDRLVILLSKKNHIQQFTVPIKRKNIESVIRQFRLAVENPRHENFQLYAKTLHNWLIQPIKKTLTKAQVNTLIWVPDYTLHAIPIAAISDGEKFLIEEYALSTIPSLISTPPKALALKQTPSALILSLNNTETNNKIQNIHKILGGKLLMNQKNNHKNVMRSIQQKHYSIIHMASQSTFASSSRHSHLETYDKSLNIKDLEKLFKQNAFQEKPLDLLVLSASKTNIYDKRSTLGLMGIAINTNARSVIGTLWQANNHAITNLMSSFYKNLLSGQTKNRALQNAQRQYIQQAKNPHPAYWSAPILIGSWL